MTTSRGLVGDAAPQTRPRFSPRAAGWVAGALTAAGYAPGLDRALGYDAAETVGYFVLAPSPGQALTKQRAFNNHPLFSFLENLVVQVAGHSDEWLLRILPISCAAASVGVLVWAVARALGPIPSVVVGLVTASNPMLVEIGRAVRGYSLMLLVTVVSTVLHLRLLRSPDRNARAGYLLTACVGLLTHLLTAPVFVAHALDTVRRGRADRTWWKLWAAVAGSTVLFYGPMIDDLVDTGESRGRVFRPWFLVDLLRELLGRELPAVVLVGAAVAYGLAASRVRAPVGTFIAVGAAVATLGWLVAPENLAPRFFLWALPGAALAAGYAATRHPRATVAAVAVGCTASVLGFAPHYAESVNRYPDVAAIIDREAGAGRHVCVTNLSVPPVLAYTRAFEPITAVGALRRCDVVAIAAPELDTEYLRAATRLFRYRVDLDARDPAVVFSRRPLDSADG